MANYIALVTGAGEGCDYTIACNKNWIYMEANTLNEAHKQCEEICS